MYYIDRFCPMCRGGAIGFTLCSNHKTIVMVCDECDSTWLHPDNVKTNNVIYPSAPEFVIPDIGCSIKFPSARWAKRDEIENYGWGQYIATGIPRPYYPKP